MKTRFKILEPSVLGSVLLTMASVTYAGAPTPGTNFDCTVLASAFQNACNLNNDLADAITTATGSYTGSCAGGGRCDDSVYNKLVSASNKVGAGKLADACANLASIQSDLLAWRTADKPKIDQLGYTNLSAEISLLQTAFSCK